MGLRVKPIEDVREDIIEKINKVKLDNLINEKILVAKKKYHIKINKILSP